MVRVEGREGRQPSYAIAGGAALYNLSLQRKHLVKNLFLLSRMQGRLWKR